MLIFKNSILITAITAILCSCNGSKTDTVVEIEDDAPVVKIDSQKISAQNVFNALPGRNDVINLTTKAQAEYNSTVLNDPQNVNKYTVESSKALNLGVYGSDLNVTGVFEQTQESMLFLKCVNILAKSLGVNNAFDEKMVNRMEANKENRDSTMEIISQSFKNADTYLKENGRPGTSSLIVAGAWIEGIYTACNTAKETKNEAVVQEIYAQTESLKYLVELLKTSKLNEDVKYVVEDLTALYAIFSAKKDHVFSLDALKEVDGNITALRTKVVSGK